MSSDKSSPAAPTRSWNLRSDRAHVVWWIAFAYLAYAAVGDISPLSSSPAFSIVTSSLLFILVYFVHSYITMGARTAAKFFAVAALLGYGFEYLFINTGWVGHYVYTADLSPFLGPVPLFIPLLWASLGYFCLLASDSYLVSAVLMVVLDTGFDPRFAVTLWSWVPPGPYFGVPLANFVGWFVTSLAIFTAFYLVTRRKARSSAFAIAFYLFFGLVNGAIPDFSPGLYGAGAIATVLVVSASGLLYLNSLRLTRKGRAALLAGQGGRMAGLSLPETQ